MNWVARNSVGLLIVVVLLVVGFLAVEPRKHGTSSKIPTTTNDMSSDQPGRK